MPWPPSPALSESYLYDENGQRVKRVSNGVTTLTPFPHYEVELNGSTTTVTKYYFFNGMRIAMKENGTLTYLHSDHLGSTVLSTVGNAFQVGQGYYGYGQYRSGGSLPTDHRYTGQKLDIGSGLMYYGARYYDRTVGLFASPDTLVPDPTNVWDYHRYMYVRSNPLKYSDPSGFYTNNEIMQHFGCSEEQGWSCVEAIFGEGGSHAGLWGWLYVLQQANDGDIVTSSGMTLGKGHHLTGVFHRASSGQIGVVVGQGHAPVLPEEVVAHFATSYDFGAKYNLRNSAGSFKLETFVDKKYTYLHFDPSKVDKGGIALAGLKAGADAGPMLMQRANTCGDPACAGAMFTLGLSYTLVGYTTVLVADVVVPVTQAVVTGDTTAAWESITVEAASRLAGRAGPYVGPTYDVAKALEPSFCYGTGCPR